MKSVLAREQMADACRGVTAKDLISAKRLAEKMAGRKLPLISTDPRDSEKEADIHARIGAKHEKESHQISTWADELEALLEQAEREAVGQSGASVLTVQQVHLAISQTQQRHTLNASDALYYQVSDVPALTAKLNKLAAPRPEASTRLLRELVADLRSSKAYGNSEVSKTVLEAVNHIADRIEAALAAQPEQEKQR